MNYVDREVEKIQLRNELNRRSMDIQKIQMQDNKTLQTEANLDKKNESKQWLYTTQDDKVYETAKNRVDRQSQ